MGRGFILDNDIVPVIQSSSWNRGLQWKYDNLIRSLGQPDFEYNASDLKADYNYVRRNKKKNMRLFILNIKIIVNNFFFLYVKVIHVYYVFIIR